MDFIFDPSLVLYVPLYELDGASFASRDAYGHLGTVTGAVWRPNGYSFDGSDDFVNCGKNPVLELVGVGATVEVWAKVVTGSPFKGLVGKTWAWNAAQGWEFAAEADLLRFKGFGDQSAKSTTFTWGNDWHHVAVTFEGGTARFYHFAEDITDDSSYYNIISSSAYDLYIGQGGWAGSHLNAIIGEVRIYNRILTPSEIQHNYLATKWRYR